MASGPLKQSIYAKERDVDKCFLICYHATGSEIWLHDDADDCFGRKN